MVRRNIRGRHGAPRGALTIRNARIHRLIHSAGDAS